MRRFTLFTLTGVAGLLASPALAQTSDVPMELPAALVSQYRFRGISLSDEEFAVQGTINLTHESGFYAGVWASSLDGFGELGGSNVELDLYGGYKAEIADGLTLDAGVLYYAYPGSTGGDHPFAQRRVGLVRKQRIDHVCGQPLQGPN